MDIAMQIQTANGAKLAYSIKELAAALGIGRTRIYEAIGEGELIAHKFGRRTVIFLEDVLHWMKTFKALDLNA
jgi:excisionase family DNA binding protein